MSCDNGPVKTSSDGSDSVGISIIIDDPEIIDGLEIADYNRNRVIQLADGSQEGTAEQYFLGESARYDIEVDYVSESKG